jgi:hypothetical protein
MVARNMTVPFCPEIYSLFFASLMAIKGVIVEGTEGAIGEAFSFAL